MGELLYQYPPKDNPTINTHF